MTALVSLLHGAAIGACLMGLGLALLVLMGSHPKQPPLGPPCP